MSTGDLAGEGRTAYAARRWLTALTAFQSAERAHPLEPSDLNRMAECAFLLRRPEDYAAARELAHQRQLAAGDVAGAALSAFWLASQYLHDGELARGTGWLQRADRIAPRDDEDVLAYLALARSFTVSRTGDLDSAAELADGAVRVAHRRNDADLAALALHQSGLLHLAAGRTHRGRTLLDEAMVVATTDAISPMVTGIVYCGVIAGCWQIYDIGRAREWTNALTDWCASQPQMVGFVGECRVRRAELHVLHGDWSTATAELVGMEDDVDRQWAGTAAYVRGNLERLQGRWDEAERSFTAAARLGLEPQPGLAMLRLARGSTQAAAAMVRRSLVEVRSPGRRVPVLAAAVEALLAIGDVAGATDAVHGLETLAERQDSDVVRAVAAQARARLAVGSGHAGEAGEPAWTALNTWLRVEAPYEEASTRVLLATACRALGDVESAVREQQHAREIFTRLGARPDLDALDHHARHTLSPREVEVLRLVATGATNRDIAAQLVLSERTVDRHVSNILTKLDVPTRAGATARAAAWQLL